MTQTESRAPTAVRLHFTNVVGLGAVRLAQSLIPSLLSHPGFRIEKLYLPAIGELSRYKPDRTDIPVEMYKRYLPNVVSRFLECSLFGCRFDGDSALIVFGDIPIRCKSPQTVFVQTPLLIEGQNNARKLGSLKYHIARWLFRRNQSCADKFIVQTDWMKASLIKTYPEVAGRVFVVGQPAPPWLSKMPFVPDSTNSTNKTVRKGLRLFYPAASYPHKNHKLLAGIGPATDWPVAELVLTLPPEENPNPALPYVRCSGRLEPKSVVEEYGAADALLFLSYSESLGFPLIEAMSLDLPIICPDLPYAHALCGDAPIYFDPYDPSSLKVAVENLKTRLDAGWTPDYREPMGKIPRNWEEVADRMLRLAAEKK